MSNIIFGFLGSLPNSNNIDNWEHWKKFFNDRTIQYKENIHILLHPFDIEGNDEEIKNFINKFNINKTNFHLVEPTNHVKTEWGTNSLADATLLMLQQSLSIGVKKFVLLSPSCCPIYNLDYIYNELTANSKSWIFGNDLSKLHKGLQPTNFKFFSDDKYIDGEGKKYSLYYSNWMILDYNHIKFFFLNTTIEDPLKPTYVKVEGVYKCKFEKENERIILNNELQEDLRFGKLKEFKEFFSKPSGLPGYDGITENYCWPIEEIIFGNWVVKNIIDEGKNILSEINFILKDSIKNNLNINFELKNQLIVEFNKIKKNSNFNLITSVDNKDVRGNSLKINNNKLAIGTQWPYLNKPNIRMISPTYVNWTQVSLDPHNIFRNFKLKEINFLPVNTKDKLLEVIGDVSTLLWSQFNIKDFLDTSNPNDALQILINADEDLKGKKIRKLINNEMAMTRSLTVLPLLPSTWHPLEYSSWSLKNVVNSFILVCFVFLCV